VKPLYILRLKEHQDGNQFTNLPRVTKCGDLYKVKVNINLDVQMEKRRRLETSYWYYILKREREKPISNEAALVENMVRKNRNRLSIAVLLTTLICTHSTTTNLFFLVYQLKF
jgi:hypothetical protein